MINYDLDALVIVAIIGLLTAAIMEFVVKTLLNTTTQQKQLISLLLGWALGMVAMLFFAGDFVHYSILGLAGGVLSPGIYDIIVKGLNIKGDAK